MITRLLNRLVACATLMIVGPGCADQGPNLPACTAAVVVTVSAGTHPAIAWTPACTLEGVIVAFPGPGAIQWSVESPSQTNTISPSVTYAVTPAGARLVNGPIDLTAGTTYELTLIRFDDGHGGSFQPAGAATFVP